YVFVRGWGVWRRHPGDRLVSHVDGKVVIRIMRGLNSDGSIEDCGPPLIRLTADETVELIETRMSRPTIKRSRNRDLPRGRFVIFPESGGAVAIESQHLGQRCNALRTNAGIAGKPGGELHDRARIIDVMITPR